jgi:hypothetical protein
VQDVSEADENYLNNKFAVAEGDVESGMIYVLRSLSDNPDIAGIRNLYKIGFTTTPVENRIANAKNEPTYLCADVKVVTTWRVYNVKSSTFEAIIHKLFAAVRLQVTVDGKRPEEWYIVPLSVIEQAVYAIAEGKPLAYDPQVQQLIYLDREPQKSMKCISVRQPWAYLICSGQKDIENRSWRLANTPCRILIHASAKIDMSCEDMLDPRKDPKIEELTTSAVIGYVDVMGCTQKSDSEWADDCSRWKWILKNAKMFKRPIPFKGKQGLFDVPDIDPENLPET